MCSQSAVNASGASVSSSSDKDETAENSVDERSEKAISPSEAVSDVPYQPRKLRVLLKKPSVPKTLDNAHSDDSRSNSAHRSLDGRASQHGKRTSLWNQQAAWNLKLLGHALQPFMPSLNYIKLYAGPERPRIVNILNYYVSFVGPTFVWHYHALTSGSVAQFSRTFLQTSLHEPAFLEILLAICQADFDYRCHGRYNASKAVLGHRSRALKLLQHKLGSSRSIHDEAILATVCAMMTFDMTLKDWSSFDIHLQYLRRVMKSIGDADWLGFQGWILFDYYWAELIWATQSASVILSNLSAVDKSATESGHPSYAISTELLAFSTRLPIGFQELAQLGVLPSRLVILLIEMTDWIDKCTKVGSSPWQMTRMNIEGMKLATKAAGVISAYPSDHASSSICMALISFITSYFEGGSGHSRGLEYLTPHIKVTSATLLGTECCMWTALTIAAANETVPFDLVHRWTLLDRMSASSQVPRTWAEIDEVMRKFFWNQGHAKRWKQCWEISLQRDLSSTA